MPLKSMPKLFGGFFFTFRFVLNTLQHSLIHSPLADPQQSALPDPRPVWLRQDEGHCRGDLPALPSPEERQNPRLRTDECVCSSTQIFFIISFFSFAFLID
jgi:hypothetical protein